MSGGVYYCSERFCGGTQVKASSLSRNIVHVVGLKEWCS